MDDPGLPQTNWQNIGPTLNNNFQYVTHLDPRGRPANDTNTAQYLKRAYSTRSVRSKDVPSLHRNKSTRLVARFKRFVDRLAWQKRSRSYLFGKKYLQRQPSFVMTPDRSSFTYRFRNRDLLKRRPHPWHERSSQPVAVWKNANPMDVLLNKGVVTAPQMGGDEPETATSRGDRPSVGAGSGAPGAAPGAASGAAPGAAPVSAADGTAPGERQTSSRREGATALADDATSHSGPQNWKKVSLPVKQDRTSNSSQERPNLQEGGFSTPRNTTDPSASGSGSQPGTRSSGTKSGSESKAHVSWGSSSILDLPPTPLETRRPRPVAVDLPSVSLPFARAGDEKQPQARSPTSARSAYRPESWRRSAIVSRNEQLPDPEAPDLDIAIEFVGAWGTYLKRAIAMRAVAQRERKSWELQNERRWSLNMPYDSDLDSFSESSTETQSDDYEEGPNTNTSSSNSDTHSSSGSSPSRQLATALEPLSENHDDVSSSSSMLSSVPTDANDRESLRDASSESSSIMSDDSSRNTRDSARSHQTHTSSSMQYTPEAISRPLTPPLHVASARGRTSIHPQTPMRPISGLAPANSPRALAAMARTSAERKQFADSLDAAQHRYSVLFQQDSNAELVPEATVDAVSHATESGLGNVSLWQPEDSDKESSVPKSSGSENGTRVSALNVHKTPIKLDDSSSNSIRQEELDVAEPINPRKRPLPISPVSTPPPQDSSDAHHQLNNDTKRQAVHSRHSSDSSTSATEDAPSLLKSRSVTVRRHLEKAHKRVKSTPSRENILLMRQNTLRSKWDEEDSDSDASEHRHSTQSIPMTSA